MTPPTTPTSTQHVEYFYIVELDNESWLQDWGGDSGRSCDQGFAQRFFSHQEASAALARVQKLRSFRSARLRAVPMTEVWDLFIWSSDNSTAFRPCIGKQRAHQLVREYQGMELVEGITVERSGREITTWTRNGGWCRPPRPQRAGGGAT